METFCQEESWNILHLIPRDATNEEVAKKLFISVPTVKAHLDHIFGKLNVNNRTHATLLLMQARLRNDHNFPLPGSDQRPIGGIQPSVFA